MIRTVVLLSIVSGSVALAGNKLDLVELERKAESGDITAIAALAKYYKYDKEKALMWLQHAAEQGDAIYQFIFAQQLKYHREPLLLKLWLQRSAEQGFLPAMDYLGDFYCDEHYGINNFKIYPNFIEAVRWYQRASDAGYEKSSYKLGKMYLEGNDVPKDIVRAKSLLEKTEDGKELLKSENIK